MQKQKRGRAFRARFSVKNGEPIDLNRAIRNRVFHGAFLCLGLARQWKGYEHDKNHERHPEGPESEAAPARAKGDQREFIMLVAMMHPARGKIPIGGRCRLWLRESEHQP